MKNFKLPAIAWSRLLQAIGILCGAAALVSGEARSQALPRTEPRHILTLTLPEFSILNTSIVDGLLRYGGSTDFGLNLVREGSNVFWKVVATNSAQLDVTSLYVAQKAVQLIQAIDPFNLDTNGRVSLQAVKSLTEKLEHARQNPVWDLVSLAGAVTKDHTNLTLLNAQGTVRLAGAKLAELGDAAGREIVASGYRKTAGEMDVVDFLVKKPGTLELFVMSHCPYGQRAAVAVLDFLEHLTNAPKPTVEIRYLFYKSQANGKDTYTALHGEAEVIENLAQMLLREWHPQFFQVYLRERARCGTLPFAKVAGQLGLASAEIAAIEQTTARDRDALIREEFDYVAGKHRILDGSPTYVWEGVRIADLRAVETFKTLSDSPSEGCSH